MNERLLPIDASSHHQLRRATESDKPFLYALHCATMRRLIEQVWGWDEDWQRGDFERRFQHYLVWIIEVDDRAVGGLWLEMSAKAIYVADIQVTPELQGRGIGSAVLRQVIADAAGKRLPVELSVLHANPRARRLYERLGFRATEEVVPFIRMRREAGAGKS